MARISESLRKRIGDGLLALGLVALAGGAGYLLVQQRLTLVSEIAFAVGGLLLLTFVILEPGRTRTWITSRQVRYGSNAAIMAVVLLAILIVGNVLADRHPYRIDITANRRLSLAPQSVDVLSSFEGPIRVVAFFSTRTESSITEQTQAADLLDQYRYHYPDLETEFYDPSVELSKALEWQVTEAWRPTLFIVYEGRKEEIHEASEREITSALVRLSRETQPAVYFLTGHGEGDIDDTQDAGLGTLKGLLEEEGFQVASLNLLITSTIPADASAVILPGPQRALLDEEVGLLSAYVEDGGSALIMLDPLPDPELESPALAEWLAERWGAAFRSDVAIDPALYFTYCPPGMCPVAEPSAGNPVGRGMAETWVYFVEARSIEHFSPTQQAGGTTPAPDFSPLVQSSPDSWGETSSAEREYNEGEDTQGPLDLAATLEDAETGSRLALFGDAQFCTNLHAEGPSWNSDLFVNTLDWLTEEEELISIRPPEDVARYLYIPSNLTRNAIFVVVVILMPLVPLAIGGAVLLARRRSRR